MHAKFAKRHYEAVALAMQAAALPLCISNPNKEHMWADCVNELATMFARDNGAFDAERFKRACIPGNNVRARTA